ncbi:DUF4142 domain-containing protein [Corallococcus sicarius]|uniref:DUF4142 domain-containing protein n=1 Tax=Corallococcus sicarius TaxID=2316726 RepID=A0A3A8N4D3_9BACT|nr:DUF4142 domain-containing protein [Corallococcus sicarius]RKH38370.1 DUF4142 domain-containing protein [Corallococcus sicarius]
MKRTLHGVTLAAALFAGGVSLAQSATSPTPPPPGASGSTKPAAMKGMAEFKGFMVPTDEKAFLERLHHINQTEILQAQLAQKNSQNPDVKSYAESMIKMHTDADQKVMTYATTKKLKLAEPKPVDEMERKAMAATKAEIAKLEVLKGSPFDSSYMAGQVAAHDMAIGKVMAAQHGMNATGEMATMITTLTQELPKHRDMAYQTLGKVDDAMGVGGSGAGMQGGSMDHGSMKHGPPPSGTTGSGSMGGATGTTGGSTKTK